MLILCTQIKAAQDEDSLREVAMSNLTILCDCGFTKPVVTLDLVDRITLIQTIALNHVLLRSKAELDSFCDGLKALGVLEAMRQDPVLLQGFFTQSGVPELTAGLLMSSLCL